MIRSALAARGAILMLAAGCAATSSGPPRLTDADYPGWLRPPSAMGRDVLWLQRVTAAWGDKAPRSFDAALQASGDTLTLIGLSPLGSTSFAVVLRGAKVEFRNETPEDLPFPPRFILLDVQRVFYPWLPGDGLTRHDGEHEGTVGDERVEEVVEGGRLRERRFTRLDGKPEGSITVRYEWGRDDWTAPSRAVLDNAWFGYRLTIDTLEETSLAHAADAAAGS